MWRDFVAEYGIDDVGGRRILETALEAHDRMRAAQRTIRKHGATYQDRFGQPQMHPSVRVERDSRAAWLGALKALSLDIEPVKAIGRPSGNFSIGPKE